MGEKGGVLQFPLMSRMRVKSLKWVILGITILLGVLVLFQVTWLQRIYAYEAHQFRTAVVKSLRNLSKDVDLGVRSNLQFETQLEHMSERDVFMLHIDKVPVQADLLVQSLKASFMDYNVLTNCQVVLYDAREKRYAINIFLSTPAAAQHTAGVLPFGILQRDHDYLLLYFPNRSRYILSQMNMWIISSTILIVILIALAVSLFYIYRQQFLHELQKEFVNNFTHEFKTPVSVLKIASEVLSQPDIEQHPERLRQYVYIITDQVEHLKSQVERLLSFAYAEQGGGLPVAAETFDMEALLGQAMQKVQPLARQKSARIDLRLGKQAQWMNGDPAHLELAVINLVENGIKYSREPHIIVSTGKEQDGIFISVKDNGIGIEKKYLKKIFDRFYRVHNDNVYEANGFGIGLNFVKKIVDAHSGKIYVYSVPGSGTEFRIVLPQP